MSRLNLPEETRFEKLPVTIYENHTIIASKKVAQHIASLIKDDHKRPNTGSFISLPDAACLWTTIKQSN